MRWIVRLSEAGSSSIIVDAATFADAQVSVFRTLRELLPMEIAQRGSSSIRFEGRCFRGATAPTVFVVSEPTFEAFNSAATSFLPGTTPMMTVVFEGSKAPTGEAVEVAAAPVKPAATDNAEAPVRTGNRVLDRLNNIKKTYSSMTSGGSSGAASPLRSSAVATPKKRSAPPQDGGDTVSASEILYREYSVTPPAHAATERQKYQRQLEEALEEDRRASQAQQPSRKSAPPPAPLSAPNVNVDAASASPSKLPTKASVHLMVWGSEVGRGVPVPFSLWQPPPLSLLMGQVSALLEQPVHLLSFAREGDKIEVVLEDDDDVNLLAREVQHLGVDCVTLKAIQRPTSSHGRDAGSGRLAGETPVSFVQLKRDIRKSSANNRSAGNVSGSVTPLTSPIKEVSAPSPPPALKNPFATGASVAMIGRQDRPKPPMSAVEYLD